jgi:hypothetical protein
MMPSLRMFSPNDPGVRGAVLVQPHALGVLSYSSDDQPHLLMISTLQITKSSYDPFPQAPKEV